MGKPRKNSNKPQNNYGGDYDCENYEGDNSRGEWCHDEGQTGWGEFISWWKTKNGELTCKGNRHSCYKQKLKWLASLSEKEKEKYFKKHKNE
jgi:hypothetical protein